MIVFEAGPALLRAGEAVVGGRRIAGRLLPYGLDPGGKAARFDPVERRFMFGSPGQTVPAGPSQTGPWRDSLSRAPSGPVLVGPCSSAEPVRGAFRAATEAALHSGRPAYLLDPEPDAVPDGAGPAAVVLCSWRPGHPGAAFAGIAPARAAGLTCAAIFPLLPGWTAESGAIEELAAAAWEAGAASLTAIVPADDGDGRRGIVEARRSVEPESTDRFFGLVHHGKWSERLWDRLVEVRAAAARRGLAALPPRPIGRLERAGNAAAAARLEEVAEGLDGDEHRAALLHAGVRWIDDSRHDLSAVAREGNFLKVFPFGAEIASEAEAVLREAR